MLFKIKDSIDLDTLLNYGYSKKFNIDTGKLDYYTYKGSYNVYPVNKFYFDARTIEPAYTKERFVEDRCPIYSNHFVTEMYLNH